ncbi:hypothetical protein QFZ70_003086 [Arthrobacter sp. V1I9]|nr:hypothetical protein [Arthrobacter sp. V1I9]
MEDGKGGTGKGARLAASVPDWVQGDTKQRPLQRILVGPLP